MINIWGIARLQNFQVAAKRLRFIARLITCNICQMPAASVNYVSPFYELVAILDANYLKIC